MLELVNCYFSLCETGASKFQCQNSGFLLFSLSRSENKQPDLGIVRDSWLTLVALSLNHLESLRGLDKLFRQPERMKNNFAKHQISLIFFSVSLELLKFAKNPLSSLEEMVVFLL